MAREEIGGLDRTIRQKWPLPIKFNAYDPDQHDEDDKAAHYDEGEWVEIVVEDATETQARDMDQGNAPRFWPSGDPLMVLVIQGTTARDGEFASLFVDGREMVAAFTAARELAGVSGVARGDTVRFRWNGTKATERKPGSKAKVSPTKLYESELVAVE